MINLMIADDNIPYTEYLSRMLTKDKDVEIINISYDGLSAIDNYNNLKPDVLILDLDMPGCSGIEVLKKINSYTKNNNIIVVSGSENWRNKLHDSTKFDWSYQKTVSPSELLATIKMIADSNKRYLIEEDLDNILKNFLFDATDNTELIKTAVLIVYESPKLDWDNIIKEVAAKSNIKNSRSAYQSIYRTVKKATNRHENNFNDFEDILTPSFSYNPSAKNFVVSIARYLKKTYK